MYYKYSRYYYPKIVPKSTKDYTYIGCYAHGLFKCTMSNHKQGRGCPKCAVELRKRLCTITFDEYLNIFKQIHR